MLSFTTTTFTKVLTPLFNSCTRRRNTTMATAITRPVKKLFIATPQREGVGAQVRRSIGSGEQRHLDPFLLLDEFTVRKPAGFPNHPHRGQQTVTYMLQGAFKHKDNKGHEGTIGVGDLQYMTAGRGVIHSEMPASDQDNIGLQLWVNLAAKDKMCQPQYQEIKASNIPTAKNADGSVLVKVIAGNCFGVESNVFTATPTMYWDVKMKNNAVFHELLPIDFNAFVYVLHGSVIIDGHHAEHGACIIFGDGDNVLVKAGKNGARFVLISGRPNNEPIVQHGPFVMSSRKEIQQAFSDYAAGKF